MMHVAAGVALVIFGVVLLLRGARFFS